MAKSNQDLPKSSKGATQKKVIEEDSEDDFGSDDGEDFPVVRVQRKTDFGSREDHQDDDEEEDQQQSSNLPDDNGDDGEEEELEEEELGYSDMTDNEQDEPDSLNATHEDNVQDISQVKSKTNRKLKKLTPEQLAKEQAKIKKTGVCYLSRIPPYMKPSKLRSILSRFGELDRIFLKPEDIAIYKKRVKYGGNKKKNYTEGWVEFLNKKNAKLCEATLNGNKIGGKKTSYYYDDILNIKYLPKFKWFDLTQQISKENEVRQSKLALEVSQQHKLNKSFINNLDQSKMIKNIEKKKRKSTNDDDNNDDNDTGEHKKVKRDFKQKDIASRRADARKEFKKDEPDSQLNDVLSKVF